MIRMIGNMWYTCGWINLWTVWWRTFSGKQARIMWNIWISATTWITIESMTDSIIMIIITINITIAIWWWALMVRWWWIWIRNNRRWNRWWWTCRFRMTNDHRKHCRIVIAAITDDTFIGGYSNIIRIIMSRYKFDEWKCRTLRHWCTAAAATANWSNSRIDTAVTTNDSIVVHWFRFGN